MMYKILFGATFALSLAACGNGDRANGNSSAAPDNGNAPATVRRLAEVTFKGSMQSIVDAYSNGGVELLQPRYRAEFVYRPDGVLAHEWITAFREDRYNEQSVVPIDGAKSFEMIYDYEGSKPEKLTHYVQSNWGYWWEYDSGQKNYDLNVDFIYQNDELAFMDENYTSYSLNVDTQLLESTQSRSVIEMENYDGRTVNVMTYYGVGSEEDVSGLFNPSIVDRYTYDSAGRLAYRKREYADGFGGNFVGESYTYTATGALDTYEQEFVNGTSFYILTTFKHVVLDDPELGKVYARIGGIQTIDEIGNVSDEEVKVLLFEVADCQPSEDKPIGIQNPQWYGCFRQSIWGQ